MHASPIQPSQIAPAQMLDLDQGAPIQNTKNPSSILQVVRIALEKLIYSVSKTADTERFTAKYPNISFYTHTDGTKKTAAKVALLWAVTFCTGGLLAIFLLLSDLIKGEHRTVQSDQKQVMCQLIDEMASFIYRAQFEINDVRAQMCRKKMALGLLTEEQPSTSMEHLKYEQLPLEGVFGVMRADINALKAHVEALARKAKVESKNRIPFLNKDDIKELEKRAKIELTEIICLAKDVENINKICQAIRSSVLKKSQIFHMLDQLSTYVCNLRSEFSHACEKMTGERRIMIPLWRRENPPSKELRKFNGNEMYQAAIAIIEALQIEIDMVKTRVEELARGVGIEKKNSSFPSPFYVTLKSQELDQDILSAFQAKAISLTRDIESTHQKLEIMKQEALGHGKEYFAKLANEMGKTLPELIVSMGGVAFFETERLKQGYVLLKQLYTRSVLEKLKICHMVDQLSSYICDLRSEFSHACKKITGKRRVMIALWTKGDILSKKLRKLNGNEMYQAAVAIVEALQIEIDMIKTRVEELARGVGIEEKSTPAALPSHITSVLEELDENIFSGFQAKAISLSRDIESTHQQLAITKQQALGHGKEDFAKLANEQKSSSGVSHPIKKSSIFQSK